MEENKEEKTVEIEETKQEVAETAAKDTKEKKEYPMWLYYVMIGLGVILLIMCVLVYVKKSEFPVFGLFIGIVNLIYGVRGIKEKKGKAE